TTSFLYELLSRRRTSNADRKIDLRWFAGRPCGSPRAGEEFQWPEDGRQTGFGLLPSLPEGPRRIVDTIALRRDGRKGTAEGHRTRTTNAVSPTAQPTKFSSAVPAWSPT